MTPELKPATMFFAALAAALTLACNGNHEQEDNSPVQVPVADLRTDSSGPPSATVVPAQEDAIAEGTHAAFVEPKSHAKIDCSQGPDGVSIFQVVGISNGIAGTDQRLLLWVRPVQPPAGGWYLQRVPHGIDGVEQDGRWSGTAQIGNLEFPPHVGDILDVAVTIVDGKEAAELLGATEVQVKGQPIGRGGETAVGVVIARTRR